MAKKMKLRVSARLLKKRVRRNGDARAAKHCRFTSGEVPVEAIDYKNATFLRNFLTERGKIISSRISGNAARYQRLVAREIKKARAMALLPYLALERRVISDRPERGDRDRSDRSDRGERGSRERRHHTNPNNVSLA
jgi:small subunit ribosomal protein S18